MSQFSQLGDIKKLFGNSMIYGIGSILLKAIVFLLIPLYTRHLSTTDYGVLALTTSVSTVLAILFTFELKGAVTYFYYQGRDDEQRRVHNGTLWLAMIAMSLGMTLLLDLLGRPAFQVLFRSVPFDPYFRITIWSTFFTIFAQFPQLIFQIRERPFPYVIMLALNTFLNIGMVIYFIVIRRMGVLGYLTGILIASMIMAVPYAWVAFKHIRPAFRWALLSSMLTYSLPLVPHSLSSWLLELSDRFILEKFVPLAQIGIYSLGYQFGSIVNMAASALNAAWTPYVFRITDQDPENSKIRVARLATYYVLVLAVVFLIIGLFVRDVNHIATEQSYHEAYLVTYWIVVAQLMQGLYYLPVTVLFLIKKTKYIPIVTLASAVVDITLNLVLLPRFGMLAAAWAGFASKVVMVLIVSLIANRLYPIPYEYGRLFKLLLGVIMLFVAGLFVPFTSLWLSLGAKVVLFLLLPAVLALLKFYTSDERDRLRLALHRITFIRVADKLV